MLRVGSLRTTVLEGEPLMANTSIREASLPPTELFRLGPGSRLQILEQVSRLLLESMIEDRSYEVELWILPEVQPVPSNLTVWEEYVSSLLQERF